LKVKSLVDLLNPAPQQAPLLLELESIDELELLDSLELELLESIELLELESIELLVLELLELESIELLDELELEPNGRHVGSQKSIWQ